MPRSLDRRASGNSSNLLQTPKAPLVVISSFDPFDPTTELWDDYWARFQTFVGANSVPVEKRALVFLTNQSRVNYKLLSKLASQQSPPKDVNALSWDEIVEYMKGQFDPTRYVVWKVRPQVTRLSFQGCHLSVLPEAWAFGSSMFEEEEGGYPASEGHL